MRAMFTGSTATTATATTATADPPDSGLNTTSTTTTTTTSSPSQQLFSPPPPPPPAVSISAADESFTRRIRSKSSLRSLRSLGSNSTTYDDDPDDTPDANNNLEKTLIRPSILRRLSPGLAARVKLLDGSNSSSKNNSPSRVGAVGRIPEEHIKELDSLHQDLSIRIQKKGRTWNGLHRAHKERKQQQQSLSQQQQQQQEQQSCDLNHLEVPDPVLLEKLLADELYADEAWEPSEQVSEQHVLTSVLQPDLHSLLIASVPEEPEVRAETEAEAEAKAEAEAAAVPEAEVAAKAKEEEEEEEEEEEDELQQDKGAIEEPLLDMATLERSRLPLRPGSTNGMPSTNPTDFEKYLKSTSDNESAPPPPPPKDSPRPLSISSANSQSYFNPLGLQRSESIYSFSRASFSNQLSQLTSISLPQPSLLEAGIASIPTAAAAVRALTGAADQIQIWIKKASGVLSGLDAEDDVEWAAAGGREGLDGVDGAITRFESLINVYVKAIEDVQMRDDIENVSTDQLNLIVVQMDGIIHSWSQIKDRLKGVKEQVELAMEWEELWSNVLGDVGVEVENLGRLIFEMEEKRHWTMAGEQDSSATGLDINELETIVEETPAGGRMSTSKRFSLEPLFAAPTLDMPIIQTPHDDSNHSNLIALFARIQPLRASLDFLPMRLSMFQSRAVRIFPSACQELEDRRSQLEKAYKGLEADAEALRDELSEDRWILVFRNAGNQAQKMFESVERSIGKLQEAIETSAQVHNPAQFTKRVESYDAKKQHYVAAIERVVSIIQKGVNDRLTVNGETLRLLSDMTSRVDALKASIRVMDASLEDISFTRSQHLRDSISSILTMDSPLTGSVPETPGSSPASSVIMTPANALKRSTTPVNNSSRRGSSVSSVARTTMSKVRRYSGLPQVTSTLTAKKSAIPKASLGVTSPTKHVAATPTPAARKPVPRTPALPPALANRPRWTTSTNTSDLDKYKSNSLHTPFRKSSAQGRTSRPSSTLPMTPYRRDMSVSPAPMSARSVSRVSSRLASRSPSRVASPTPNRSLLDPPPYSKLRRPDGLATAPRSRQSFAGLSFSRSVSQDHSRALTSPTKAPPTPRPETSLGHASNRRISLIPLPKGRTGKDNAPSTRSKLGERPPWRG
ncbi:KAR9 family protein [Aspergillus brunneoviolaceus CBS 621.78]|uniref:KAR9-domain-containing protein n=1 Tax=Aspergillus brunneoviolaceus CBS 621.78 TaxID=1450534 RepID=A0ACD1FZM2_9EURO|nr:KAR9-domain-containing protein [Aspergillus brunneoviolaceus CBS 621.78]RAH42435.1 KAR9-domain-containing protein [Aspergillus brunneoviolaceus CBS 621.78]